MIKKIKYTKIDTSTLPSGKISKDKAQNILGKGGLSTSVIPHATGGAWYGVKQQETGVLVDSQGNQTEGYTEQELNELAKWYKYQMT